MKQLEAQEDLGIQGKVKKMKKGFIIFFVVGLLINGCVSKAYIAKSKEKSNKVKLEKNIEYNYAFTEATKQYIFGNIKQAIDYVFQAIDPNDKDVKFFISWGDGDTEWTSFEASDTPITVSHTWNKEGTYTVIALVMNTDNSISSWTKLEVTMPRNKAISNPILNLLQSHHSFFPLLQLLLQRHLGLQ